MTESLPPGLYEVLVTEVLAEQLASIEERLIADHSPIRAAEVADRVALHLSRVVERAIDGAPEDQRVDVAIAVARDLVTRLAELVAARPAGDLAGERPVEPGQVLRSITARRPDGTPDVIAEPLIPLLDTTLLTNAPGEPRVGSQVLAEVASADRIDVVMAFIRRSGIRPLLDALRRHCERSGEPVAPSTPCKWGQEILDQSQARSASSRYLSNKKAWKAKYRARRESSRIPGSSRGMSRSCVVVCSPSGSRPSLTSSDVAIHNGGPATLGVSRSVAVIVLQPRKMRRSLPLPRLRPPGAQAREIGLPSLGRAAGSSANCPVDASRR